jgi:hypothetical protein
MPSIASWEETAVEQLPELDQHESIATESQQTADPAWGHCIDALLQVLSAPFNDGSVVPPTRDAITAALRWIVYLKSKFPTAPPTLITPEPNGGIIVARRDRTRDGADFLSELTFYNNLTAESTLYHNGRILEMSALPIQPPGLRGRA